jgi:hypothetical protein
MVACFSIDRRSWFLLANIIASQLLYHVPLCQLFHPSPFASYYDGAHFSPERAFVYFSLMKVQDIVEYFCGSVFQPQAASTKPLSRTSWG